ncbi:Pre-mRNA polyadenylation factor Fip1 [Corchorus olitorius]|uniref:Pre-mRNA polyadenylation factor Fip1 n=1 Tax=Corchorus olitorius TaxID=93759 RepID=A0A1R3GK23_9ROSI|nr:Pre-mRNA polyadenylation factor Fip1 [Corchorus olitorius]
MATMDDDFGELYVDVEIQASSALGVLCNEKEDDHPIDGAKSTSADEKFVIDSVSEDSDSDDDLNIVLNDDDCEKFPVSGAKSHAGGNEEDENGDFGVKDSRSDKTSRRLEPVGDESEFNSSPNGVDRGSGAKIGVHSQFSHFKYMRPHPSNMRVNGCTGVSSFSSMSGRGDLEDDFYSQKRGGSLVQVANRRANTSSHAYQFGYGFSLPWTIFDVNMDAFEEKPWRNPGVDITNFFNFGFNEDSWKQYCNSLEEFQKQSSKSTRIPVYYYPKLEQAHEAEAGRKAATEEAMSGGVAELESSFKCADGEEMSLKLPKGRAIHVEDSIIERQPSMDLRCPRFQDSDVIIQITVQDSTVDSSITTKEELGHGGKASESRKLDAEYDSSDDLSKTVRNVSTSSSSGRSVQHKTASNQTSLETNNRGNDKLSKTDRGCHPNMDACFSEAKAIVEAMETKNKELEVPCRNTDQSDPCIVETEPSLEDQSHFSPMISFSECYSAESSEDSVHDASIEVASPSRRQSLAYDTRLQNSVASYIKSSRIDGPKTKSDGGEGYSVHMTTIPDKQKHESWRQRNSVKQRIFLESGDDTSPLSDAEDDRIRFPRCRAPIEERRKHHCGRPNGINDSKIHPKACNDTSLWSNVLELYDSDYSPDYCGRQKGSPQDRGYHDREDFSYYRERGPCADSHLRSVGTKDHLSLKEESDQTVRKSWNQKEFYHKSRVGIDKEDDMGRFWYCGRRLPSQHGLGPYPYRESGRLISR